MIQLLIKTHYKVLGFSWEENKIIFGYVDFDMCEDK